VGVAQYVVGNERSTPDCAIGEQQHLHFITRRASSGPNLANGGTIGKRVDGGAVLRGCLARLLLKLTRDVQRTHHRTRIVQPTHGWFSCNSARSNIQRTCELPTLRAE
jgi:hypothetical protein